MNEEIRTMLEKMRELKEQQQNNSIYDLIDMVSNPNEKINKKDYTPTDYDRLLLSRIVMMINYKNERLK